MLLLIVMLLVVMVCPSLHKLMTVLFQTFLGCSTRMFLGHLRAKVMRIVPHRCSIERSQELSQRELDEWEGREGGGGGGGG